MAYITKTFRFDNLDEMPIPGRARAPASPSPAIRGERTPRDPEEV